MTSTSTGNPYVGPFSFSGADEGRFFGRQKETDDVMSLIHKSKLTILFGSSGTGKTSLIHAKLLPQLRREYFHPIYIRVNFASADPLAFVKEKITQELRRWEPNLPAFENGQSLLEYAADISIFQGLIKPVLFFDQFEELFTLGPQNDPVKIRSFIVELSDLVEKRLSDKLKNQVSIDNLNNFKVVFSLRQDWIAYLEDFSHIMPSVLENRFRLRKLTFLQAEEAIYCPAEKYISREAARTIIGLIGEKAIMKDVSDEHDYHIKQKTMVTDPFVLSLYCFELYESFAQTDEQYISSDFVEKHEPKELIRNYYLSRTRGQERIKLLIEKKLVNESGKRMTISLQDFTEEDTELEKEVRSFAGITGVVRIMGDENSEIEIVHDKLAIEAFENRTRTIREEAVEKEKVAEGLRHSAQKAEEEAEKMRLVAAQMRKRASRISIISFILVVAGLVATFIIWKNGKDNYTVLGLREQLDSKETELASLQNKAEQLKQENLLLRKGNNTTASPTSSPNQNPSNQQTADLWKMISRKEDSINKLNALLEANTSVIEDYKRQVRNMSIPLNTAAQVSTSVNSGTLTTPSELLIPKISNVGINNTPPDEALSIDKMKHAKNKEGKNGKIRFSFNLEENRRLWGYIWFALLDNAGVQIAVSEAQTIEGAQKAIKRGTKSNELLFPIDMPRRPGIYKYMVLYRDTLGVIKPVTDKREFTVEE